LGTKRPIRLGNSNDRFSQNLTLASVAYRISGEKGSPPAHAIVLSVDEKSQIQALDRTQLGLPLKRGRGATMTHDYKRNGTTTLFAALNVLDGSVIGRNMQRHRHQEFIGFLNAVEAELPPDKAVHVIRDNYATHKQPRVRAWLDRHPRMKQPHAVPLSRQVPFWTCCEREMAATYIVATHPPVATPLKRPSRLSP